MILPTIASFDHVTGDIDKILLDVDVRPNRSGNAKKILYGKDVVAILEHSGVRANALHGKTFRGYSVSSSRASNFPYRFKNEIENSPFSMRPSMNTSEMFSYNGSDYLTLKFCTGLPNLPDFSFTESPIVTETSGYVGALPYGSLVGSVVDGNLEDMKLQQYAFIDFGMYGWFCREEPAWYQKHGTCPLSEPYVFWYGAEDWYDSPETKFDGWGIMGNSSGPTTMTYSTDHISKAQIWVAVNPFRVGDVYSWVETREGEEVPIEVRDVFDIPRCVFKASESTNGTLSLSGADVAEAMRREITSTGHTIQTMDTVRRGHTGPGRGVYGIGYGDFHESGVDVSITAVFQFDNHTKWW